MFKTGDIVEITADAAATGMLDFKTGKGYEVINTANKGRSVVIRDEGGCPHWYFYIHFKLKEDTIVEKKECLFKEGQTVYCSVFGKGVVSSVSLIDDEIHVEFSGGASFNYDVNGIIYGGTSRSLFFSPPVVIGDIEPLFEPTLKKGDEILVVGTRGGQLFQRTVKEETETHVLCQGAGTFEKIGYTFYRLGEKINFK